MKVANRNLVRAGAIGLALLMAGFMVFANTASHGISAPSSTADGIVVLTGPDHRIVEGSRLLNEGWGKRLLISGVNPQITRDEIRRLVQGREGLFDCCVDVGYVARDTTGNAVEARAWVQARGYQKIIVVTSSYHMPRSMLELSRKLPGIELIPFPVVPRSLHGEPWWLNAGAMRTMASEYVKLFPAAIRYAVTQAFRPAAPTTPNAKPTVAGG